MRTPLSVLFVGFLFPLLLTAQIESWKAMGPVNTAHPRHENSFVEAGNKFYLLGGRGLKPIDIYDPNTNSWSQGKQPPIELHHFQAVSHEGLIYVIGAFTGGYPHEVPISHIYIYDPSADLWIVGPSIPEDRRRGAAGVVVIEGKFYIVCGIVNGHRSHWVPWMDEYDPQTNTWKELADAPRARDHFQAAYFEGKIYAAGGRRSGSGDTPFQGTLPEVDVYDMKSNSWSTLPSSGNIPTLRAGCTSIVRKGKLIVIGGESPTQQVAHNEVEALDLRSYFWKRLDTLQRGRHGTQAILTGNQIYIAGGCGNRGGNPELTHLEVLGEPTSSESPAPTLPRGELILEQMEVLKTGEVEMVLSNSEGTQALVLAYLAADQPIASAGGMGFPKILSAGEEITLSFKRKYPEIPLQVLVKAYGKEAPLEIEIP
ncbi:MAG: kelch repeat-containing protein [Bacteroidota bacterium]